MTRHYKTIRLLFEIKNIKKPRPSRLTLYIHNGRKVLVERMTNKLHFKCRKDVGNSDDLNLTFAQLKWFVVSLHAFNIQYSYFGFANSDSKNILSTV